MSAYLQHLAQANEIQPVFAARDILDSSGKCLLPKGSAIDTEAAELLAKASLAKEIEYSIALEQEFELEIIQQLFASFIMEDPSLRAIFDLRDLRKKIDIALRAFADNKILCQKLNVLAIQLPDVFDQSFFCSWMALAILASEDQPQENLNTVFIAALAHDFGLLHISPSILFKEGALSGEEWQALQEHVYYSGKILKDMSSANKSCIRAVMEHHEFVDGTGYPKGKMQQQISDLGRLLQVLDSVNAVYRKHYQPRERTLRDMLPLIQMSTLSRGGVHSDALMAMLKGIAETDHCTIHPDLIPAAVDLVHANAGEIGAFLDLAKTFGEDVGTKHKDIKILALQNTSRLIRSTLDSCGIVNEAYMRWIEQVRDEQLMFAYRELEDVLLMTEEIKFHMRRYLRQIALYLGQDETPLTKRVVELQKQVESIPRAAIPEEGLAAYLKGAPPQN